MGDQESISAGEPAGREEIPQAASLAVDTEIKTLRQDFADLRSMMVTALAVLVLLSMIGNLYLFREMMTTRKDLAAAEARIKPAADQYNREEAPVIQAFVNNLVFFARSNPDFQKILQKYNIVQGQANSPAPVSPGGVSVMPVKQPLPRND